MDTQAPIFESMAMGTAMSAYLADHVALLADSFQRLTGRRLIEAAEQWAQSRGCTEMGSDAEIANTLSHRAHAALGYEEVERVVSFAKRLVP